MGRVATKEEDARWSPHDDPYDAQRLVVKVRKRDGKHHVEIHANGIAFHDKLDVYDSFKRKKCREAAISKCQLPDEAHEDIESKLLAGAEAADSTPNAEIFRPVVTMLDTVKPRKVEWLWANRIAIGKNNLLCGDPGLGKSLVAVDMAARTSNDKGFPDSHGAEHNPGGVVILTCEDDASDTLVPRLHAHGADLSRIALVEGLTETDGDGRTIHGIDLAHDIAAVIAATKQVKNCRLVIVDTISDYITGKTDSHKNADVRGILNPLARAAADQRFATLLISHFRKGDGRAVHAAMGSIAFIAQSRVAWAITRCPTHPRRRLMTCIKNNLAQDTTGLAFHIDPWEGDQAIPVAAWEAEPLRMSADQAMAQTQVPRGRRPAERMDAAAWLRDQLSDGPKDASAILGDAEASGYNRRTVQRAFDQLECERFKGGFRDGWKWHLPRDDTDDDTAYQSPTNSHPRNLRENPEEINIERETKCTVSLGMTDCERHDALDAFNTELANCNGHDDGSF